MNSNLVIFGIIAIGFSVMMIIRSQKGKKQVMEIKYMQTTPIADAVDLVETMSAGDPTYRHYVEVKGILKSDEPVFAPFSHRDVAFYSNKLSAVCQETYTVNRNGVARQETRKKESVISEDMSPIPVYVTDSSSSEKIYIDMDSFRDDLELQNGNDTFEPFGASNVSSRYRRYAQTGNMPSGYSTRHDLNDMMNPAFYNHGNQRFLGYNYKEGILNANQPIYILGEMYKGAAGYRIGRAMVNSTNQSKLTYKSEDQLVDETQKSSSRGLIIGIAGIVLGVLLLFGGLF